VRPDVLVVLLAVSFSWTYCVHANAGQTNDLSSVTEDRRKDLIGPQLPPERLSERRLFEALPSVGQEVLNDIEYVITSPLRMDRTSALIAGGVGLTIGSLMAVDETIQRAFQENRNDTNDQIADALEEIGFGRTVLAANIGLIGAGWLFREHAEGSKLLHTALVSLEAQLFTEAIAGLGKFAVGRARPDAGEGAHVYNPFEGFDKSFPSSHAARSFAVAAVFADRYEQPIPFLLYTGATLITLSRIYVNEHFASDVFAGAALGFVMGKALSWRHRQPERRYGWSVLPFVADARGGLGLTLELRF